MRLEVPGVSVYFVALLALEGGHRGVWDVGVQGVLDQKVLAAEPLAALEAANLFH